MAGVLNSSAWSPPVPAASPTVNARGGDRNRSEVRRKKGRRISFVLSRPRFMPGDAWSLMSVFGAFDVRAVFGHHHNPGTGADMRRHGGAHAVGQHRGLIGRRGGLTLGDG